jgi:RNA polymerase sigma-70 factor, ECF subfamily
VTDARLAALETLYRRRFPVFLRVAIAVLRDEDRARDAVQDGFASAIRDRTRFRGEGPLEAWVWRMVVNAALRMKRPERPVPGEHALNGSAPEVDVRSPIAALPERQRLVLFLRYYADLDYRAIAEVLAISPGTVGATLHAAHATLRQKLEEVPR